MGATDFYDIPYPEQGDIPDGAGQMKALADRVDEVVKINADKFLTGLSTARPAVAVGALLFETDTNRIMLGVSVASTNYWVPMPGTNVFSVRQTTQQSLPDGVHTPINFQTVDYDPFAFWVAGTPTRFQPKFPGRFGMTGGVGLSSNTVSFRSATWAKNGTILSGCTACIAPVNGTGTGVVDRPVYVTMNGTTDYIEIRLMHFIGAALTTTIQADFQSTMHAVYLGS